MHKTRELRAHWVEGVREWGDEGGMRVRVYRLVVDILLIKSPGDWVSVAVFDASFCKLSTMASTFLLFTQSRRG